MVGVTEAELGRTGSRVLLLDSSVLIGAERQRLALNALVADYGDLPAFVSAVTVSDLYHGVHRARAAAMRARRLAFVESALRSMTVLPIDDEVAVHHSAVWAALEEAGRMIGMNDLWIAATALVNGAAVITAN